MSHQAVDGFRFRISGPFDLGEPFTSTVEMSIAGRRQEFTAGPASLADDVARAVGVEKFDEEFGYQGGALLTARTTSYDPQIRLTEDRLIAAWRGEHYCVVTQLYRASTADLLAVLRTLRIQEHADGLAIRPDPGAGSAFAGPATLVKQVPGLGLLELAPLTPQHSAQLPSRRGMMTSAGELFRDTLSDGSDYFVLVTADTWLTVMPLGDTALEQLPTLVGQLSVQKTG
ncbi:hypothetical protein [Rhizocola hellebori]|uniref:hypothetical protein n=1 Tax=Rhizocola hellebori TaxID=1392758 RepID=UPI001943BA78|nr:hypothetical protein [Rhizocola hellebori]